VDTIKKTMSLDKAGVLIADGQKKPAHYKIAKVIGFNEKNGISLVKDGFLTEHLSKTQKPLVKEELSIILKDSENEKEKQNLLLLYKYMNHIEASLCLPLVSNKKLIGIIVLGEKISKAPYTKEDLGLLDTLSKQAGIALENAILYKQVSDFNKTLKSKVDFQTKEIMEKAQKMQKLANMRSEFLDIASHQLRTPVSVINGTLSMMIDGDFKEMPEEEKQKFMRNVYIKGIKLKEIIEDILSASEMNTGTLSLPSAKESDISIIVKKATDSKRGEAKTHKISLVLKKSKSKLPKIKINEQYFEHAILNLIDNAIKYTKKGKVEIKTVLEDNNIIVSVKDNGIGIPKKELPKLFSKFSRAKNAKEMYADGSGLGLFIVKQVAKAHKGDAWAESEEGKGSIFYIKLPVLLEKNIQKK
jgi:signal transduction histidine kinase